MADLPDDHFSDTSISDDDARDDENIQYGKLPERTHMIPPVEYNFVMRSYRTRLRDAVVPNTEILIDGKPWTVTRMHFDVLPFEVPTLHPVEYNREFRMALTERVPLPGDYPCLVSILDDTANAPL